jgi:hypothetical protein
MKKVRFHYPNPIQFDVDTRLDVDVYIDRIVRSPVPRENIRIIILEEPRKGFMYNLVRNNPRYYTYLLTFHSELLKRNVKAKRFLMMVPWITNYKFKEKQFSVSTVVGGKKDSSMEGYALRHEIWRKRKSIIIPRKFYLSGDAKFWHTFVPWTEVSYDNELVLGDSKEPLFDSMFHIAIENTAIKHYFSEKLLDCFQTKTVPVYYGCRNIEEFFNTEGMFRVWSIDEMVEVCNQLTPEVYERMKPAIEDNYQRSMAWTNPKQQVEEAVKSLLNG